RRLAHSIALFCAANPVASVVGAPISGLILEHIHWFGFSSWRWLLILEGVPAVLGGVLTYLLLPERPAQAQFLTDEEKDWLIGELNHEERQKLTNSQLSVGRTLVRAGGLPIYRMYRTGYASGACAASTSTANRNARSQRRASARRETMGLVFKESVP